MKTIAILATALAAGSVMAGPFDQPYSIVESGAASEVRKESSVGITKVDGNSTRNPRRTDPIPRGKHLITVAMSGRFRPESIELPINLEACVRYVVVAEYEVKMGPDWKPKVYAEPIPECRKKFKLGK
jgi:hypothetical protein